MNQSVQMLAGRSQITDCINKQTCPIFTVVPKKKKRKKKWKTIAKVLKIVLIVITKLSKAISYDNKQD